MPIKNTAALLLEEPRVRDHREELVYLPRQYGRSLERSLSRVSTLSLLYLFGSISQLGRE